MACSANRQDGRSPTQFKVQGSEIWAAFSQGDRIQRRTHRGEGGWEPTGNETAWEKPHRHKRAGFSIAGILVHDVKSEEIKSKKIIKVNFFSLMGLF